MSSFDISPSAGRSEGDLHSFSAFVIIEEVLDNKGAGLSVEFSIDCSLTTPFDIKLQ